MQDINSNPDLKVTVKLEKGSQPGTSEVVLEAVDHFPVHVTPFWDNLGREAIGVNRFGVTTVHNNMLGFGDTATNATHFTRHSFGTTSQYEFPLWRPFPGTKLGVDYAYSNVGIAGVLEPLQINSRAHIFTGKVKQPVIRASNFTLDSELAVDIKQLNVDLLELPFNRDRLSLLRPSLSALLIDSSGYTQAQAEAGIGLDMFGGTSGDSPFASKVNAGSHFLRFTGALTRVQRLPLQTTAVVRTRYQFSPDRLPAAEQFQIGGAYTVRGYTEGRLLGDQGWNTTAELYTPLLFVPKAWKLPKTNVSIRHAIQLVGFTDIGMTFVNQTLSGESRNETLLGAGVGVRVNLTKRMVGRVDVGFPLLKQFPDENRTRLHFGLQSTLF